MRVLRKGFTKWETLRRVLYPVITDLQFATFLPIALIITICYPFLLSSMQDSRPRILLHETPQMAENCSIIRIRQAVVVPPVFVSAMDQNILGLIEPLRELTDTLLENPEGPQLYSLFNEKTPPLSRYVAPSAHNVQGLLFTYVYVKEKDAAQWETALEALGSGAVPTTMSNYVDRLELEEAELSTASSAQYSIWPGINVVSEMMIWFYAGLYVLYKFSWICSTNAFRPLMLLVTIGVRIGAGIFGALSVVSVLYPAFNTLVLFRFLWFIILAAYMGIYNSCQAIEAAETAINTAPTALNRLVTAYSISFNSFVEHFSANLALSVISVVLMYLTQQPTLMPLTAFMIAYLFLDTFFHFTTFAAIMYIDMAGLEFHDFVSVERPSRRKNLFFKKASESRICQCLHRIKRYFRIEFIFVLPVLSYLALHLKGGYFINRIHPHIKHALTKPEYIDVFIDPLSTCLQDYEYLEVFRPIIFEVSGHFTAPHAKSNFTFSTLRYGNILSTILEVFCLMIFISSLCMIFVLIVTDRKHLNLNIRGLYAPEEHFAEYTLDVGCTLDIIKVEAEGDLVAALALSGQLVVVDLGLGDTIPQYSISLPQLKNPWAISRVLLNTKRKVVAIVYPKSVELYDYHCNQKVYEVDLSRVLEAPPLDVLFINDTLVLITQDGRIVEFYMNQPPRVFPLIKGKMRWAAHHTNPPTHAIICDSENVMHLCKRFENDGKIEWTLRKIELLEAYLVCRENGDLLPPLTEIPSTQGMLQHPVPWTLPFTGNDTFMEAVSVPDIQMWIGVTDRRCMFVDVHSGVILKYVALTDYKPRTLRVFHSQPTHCAFCGSISFSSFSIAYESLENEHQLVVQTYRIENKSRNNICLRIERDPHETRCRGFTSAVSTRYYVKDAVSWQPTDINMIIGIRRREPGSVGASHVSADWEGFALSCAGVISRFDLDEGSNDQQLLTGAPSPATQLGPKSICVGFGNMLKVLFLQPNQ